MIPYTSLKYEYTSNHYVLVRYLGRVGANSPQNPAV